MSWGLQGPFLSSTVPQSTPGAGVMSVLRPQYSPQLCPAGFYGHKSRLRWKFFLSHHPWHLINLSFNLFSSLNFPLLFSAYFHNL